jgi:hypothetical protein
MALKIENKSTIRINPEKLVKHIRSIIEALPGEHIRGLGRLIIVDYISEPKLDVKQRDELPGLYHPKLPGSPQAWLEIALSPIRAENRGLWERLKGRLAFKANVTATVISLIGQHYYMTLSHGVRKTQYEQAVRNYVEKQLTAYSRSRRGLLPWLMRPIRPYLEKLAKWLAKRYERELSAQKRKK